MTKNASNSTATYSQAELDARLQAERVQMANDIASRALDPLQTFAKLLSVVAENEDDWVDVIHLGQTLELAVMGAYMQTIRIANGGDLGYGATPPYAFALEDVMLEWKDAQKITEELRKQAR